jgi:PKD repeat protein
MIMTRTVLLSVLLLCSISTVAQKYYERQMGWVDGQDIRKIMVQSDTSFMAFGNYLTIGITNQWWAYAMQINLQGDSICGRHYEDEEAQQLGIFDATKINGGYAVPLNVYVDAYHTHTGLQIVDSCGDYSFRSDYVSPLGNTVYYTIARTFDNGYLLGGSIYPPTVLDFKPYLLKVDAYGTVLWERAYTNVPKDGVVADILPAADSSGYFILSSYNSDELTYTLKTRITKINEGGDSILIDKIYDFETDYYAGAELVYDYDGNIMMGGSRHPYDYHGFICKLSGTTLDTIWVNRNNGAGCTNIIPLSDGSYIIGNCDRNYINPSGLLYGQAVIYKLNALGEIQWYRNYGGEGNDYCYDLSPSPDGGYIMAGRTDTLISNGTGGFYSYPDIYIVKTNCMGLLTLPQAAFSYTYDTTTLVAHFQNLSQYTYPDSIDGGYYIWDFGDGNTLVQTTDSTASANFTHVYTKNEPHTVTLTAIVCNDTSVYSTQIVPIAVGVASPLPPPKEGGLVIFPNPANDVLQILLPNQRDNAQIHITNLLGSTLKTVPLPPHYNQQYFSIATHDLPNGVYLVSYMADGKAVATAKVVVQH